MTPLQHAVGHHLQHEGRLLSADHVLLACAMLPPIGKSEGAGHPPNAARRTLKKVVKKMARFWMKACSSSLPFSYAAGMGVEGGSTVASWAMKMQNSCWNLLWNWASTVSPATWTGGVRVQGLAFRVWGTRAGFRVLHCR